MTLDLRLRAYAPNGAGQGLLPAPSSFSAAIPLNDIPALTMDYGVNAPRSNLLGQPVEVALEVSADAGATWTEPEDCRFLYLTDGRDPIKTADAFAVEAKGYVWRLSKTRVLDSGLAVGSTRSFNGVTVGALLNTLWTEATARGALAGMTLSGGGANDASGSAWTGTISRNYELGKDYLSILTELAAAGLVDFRMSGRTLKLYKPDTTLATDRTITATQVKLLPTSVTEAPFRRTWEGLAGFLHIAGDGDVGVDVTNGGALAPWGRWEDYISQGGVSDVGTLTALANRYQTLSAAARQEVTHAFTLEGSAPNPLVDYWPGDYIWSVALDGTKTRYRVRQVTLQSDGTTVQGNAVLNDLFQESDIRTQRAVDALLGSASDGGSTGGLPGADILQPAAPGAAPTLTSTGYLDALGNPLAQITVDWPDVVTNLDGTAIKDLALYEVWVKSGATGSANPWSKVAETDNANSIATLSPYTPGSIWTFKVRAVDASDNRGPFSPVAQVTAAVDTTPPPTPSTPTTTSRNSVAVLVWDGLATGAGAMPVDFDYCEVHVTTTNVAPAAGAATQVGKLYGRGQVAIPNIPYATTYYGWLIARDKSKNASGASGSVPLNAPFLTTDDILNGAIQTAKVSGPLFTGTVIPNPRFEEWDTANTAPQGWVNNGQNPATKETASQISGTASVRMNPTAALNSNVTQINAMPVVAGETYYLAGTGRYAASGAGSATAWIGVDWHNAADAYLSSTVAINFPTTDTTATRRELAVTAPAGAAYARARVFQNPGSTVSFIADELDWRRLITTALIADLAVSNAKIADLAVTNAKINDLDISKATAGFLNVARLQAGSLTTKQVTIGDPNNLFADLANATERAQYGTFGRWAFDIQPANSEGDRARIKFVSGGGALNYDSSYFGPMTVVRPGDVISYTFDAYRQASANFAIHVGFDGLSQDGTTINNYDVGVSVPTAITTDVWTPFAGVFVVPSNVYFLNPRFKVASNAASGVVGNWFVRNVKFGGAPGAIQTAASGERIVIRNDGSGGVIEAFTGQASEILPSIMDPTYTNSRPGLLFKSGTVTGKTEQASLTIQSEAAGFSRMDYTASSFYWNLYTVPTLAMSFTDGGLSIQRPLNVGSVGAGQDAKVYGKIWSDGSYADTTTAAANAFWAADHHLARSTSLARFKLKKKAMTLEESESILGLVPKTWYDRAQVKANGGYDGLRRIAGVVAEDVEAAAPLFATYDDDGLSGVAYDRIAVALIPLVRELWEAHLAAQ